MKRSALLITLGLALTACGGDDTGSGTYSGTVGGQGMSVKSAIFGEYTQDSASSAFIGLFDGDVTCADLQNANAPARKNFSVLAIVLGATSSEDSGASASASITPGTYSNFTIPPPARYFIAAQSRTDATCDDELDSDNSTSTAGTVELDTYEPKSGGAAKGRFDLTIGSQADRISGTFDAVYCPLPSDPDESDTDNGCE